jgi:hypothetical protein
MGGMWLSVGIFLPKQNHESRLITYQGIYITFSLREGLSAVCVSPT